MAYGIKKLGNFINNHKLDGKKMRIEIYRTDIGTNTPINWQKL